MDDKPPLITQEPGLDHAAVGRRMARGCVVDFILMVVSGVFSVAVIWTARHLKVEGDLVDLLADAGLSLFTSIGVLLWLGAVGVFFVVVTLRRLFARIGRGLSQFRVPRAGR